MNDVLRRWIKWSCKIHLIYHINTSTKSYLEKKGFCILYLTLMFFVNLCLIYYLPLYTYVLRCSHTVDSNIRQKRTDSVAVFSVCVCWLKRNLWLIPNTICCNLIALICIKLWFCLVLIKTLCIPFDPSSGRFKKLFPSPVVQFLHLYFQNLILMGNLTLVSLNLV